MIKIRGGVLRPKAGLWASTYLLFFLNYGDLAACTWGGDRLLSAGTELLQVFPWAQYPIVAVVWF